MILVTGIGNPERKYYRTRHNTGYFAVSIMREALRYEGFMSDGGFNYKKKLLSDIAVAKWQTKIEVVLQKTKTNMNTSGKAVKKAFDKYKPEEFVLFHDDLDIKLGEFKIQKGKSPKSHNGVKSVEEKLGTKDFWRVRIGIDNRDEDNKIPGEEYVLKRFNKEEFEIMKGTCVRACEELTFTELFEKWI
jgi:PTH1 family peptidyl-tRNA hydrolase